MSINTRLEDTFFGDTTNNHKILNSLTRLLFIAPFTWIISWSESSTTLPLQPASVRWNQRYANAIAYWTTLLVCRIPNKLSFTLWPATASRYSSSEWQQRQQQQPPTLCPETTNFTSNYVRTRCLKSKTKVLWMIQIYDVRMANITAAWTEIDNQHCFVVFVLFTLTDCHCLDLALCIS